MHSTIHLSVFPHKCSDEQDGSLNSGSWLHAELACSTVGRKGNGLSGLYVCFGEMLKRKSARAAQLGERISGLELP